ncbi:hypothetical protein DMJ13_23340 [halophilic archaeon]|nr:hypothetical protein DMJ13_23340 [halophilic archaeon]
MVIERRIAIENLTFCTMMSQSLENQVTALNETQPPRYGLLRSYHESVQQALEDCSCNYPTTKRLVEFVDDPAITPQMLGNILSLLVDLDVIGVHSQRNNSNRYDLTQYDPARMDELANLLETNSEP